MTMHRATDGVFYEEVPLRSTLGCVFKLILSVILSAAKNPRDRWAGSSSPWILRYAQNDTQV
jgi:hypothetical protein